MARNVTNTFTAGTKALASEVNTNFDEVEDWLDAIAADGSPPQLETNTVPAAAIKNGVITVAKMDSAAVDTAITAPGTNTELPTSKAVVDFLSGSVAQFVETKDSTAKSGALGIPRDNTKPQVTEGNEYAELETTFTPRFADSTLVIEVDLELYHPADYNTITIAVFDADVHATDAIGVGRWYIGSFATSAEETARMRFTISAASTSARTYKVRYGRSADGTTQINRASSNLGGLVTSRLTVTEYRA